MEGVSGAREGGFRLAKSASGLPGGIAVERCMRTLFVSVVLGGILAGPFTFALGRALAQESDAQGRPAEVLSVREAVLQRLRPELRDRVVSEDLPTAFRTRTVEDGRVDLEMGVYRARYRIQERVPEDLSPEAAAREYLRRSGHEYGMEAGVDHLRVERVRGSRYGRHVRFRQTLEGVPVYRGDVTVSLDRRGQPTMVVSGYVGWLDRVRRFDPIPSISRAKARRIVEMSSSEGLIVSEPELVVHPSRPPRLVWMVPASSPSLPVSWEVLVDAKTGTIVQLLDVSLHARGTGEAVETGPRTPDSSHEPRLRADGTGHVFDPDPLTSAGVAYGGEYVDGDDQDTQALNDQLLEVPLREITQGTDGLYRLIGPYVRIEGDGDVAPALADPHAFTFTRSDDRFEAVNAYYHIDKSQRYLQSLDVGEPIRNDQVRVRPQALSADNSYHLPGENLLLFGTGGIDDAEDADVLWHEYAHALLTDTAPGVEGHFEGRALHEGWADYWAASYSRYLSEEDPRIPEHDWQHLYTWDGNARCWGGRTLDHDGHYDDDMAYDLPGCFALAPIYQWGLLWATTLMELYPIVGRTVLDRLNLASHLYLASQSGFVDAAEALLQADRDLYGGAHVGMLVRELGEAGYVDSGQYGPELTHEPPRSIEPGSASVHVEVIAQATASPVDHVYVQHAWDDGAFVQLELTRTPTGADRFAADVPLSEDTTVLRYFIEAIDQEGSRRRLPELAPTDLFVLRVAQDVQAPIVEHDVPDRISVAAWPSDLFARVVDNVGVESVWAEYTLHGSTGSLVEQNTLSLLPTEEATIYAGRFHEPPASVEEGGMVEYRLFARDVPAGNVARLPDQGSFSVPIVRGEILRALDFEGVVGGAVAQGWSRGKPDYGLHVAHSGERVWATVPDGAYPGQADRWTLDLHPVDLGGVGAGYLVFWHWYDFEHDGGATPGVFRSDARLFDGGNVKVSADAGRTWRVLEPEGGYSGTIAAAVGNPLEGEPGFGGYSFGWRREIMPLPRMDDLRIRFEFGTGNGNDREALFFAGWYVDDVTITTERPRDTEPPRMEELPPGRIVRTMGPGQPPPSLPTLSIRVHDDVGLESVVSRYAIQGRGGRLNRRRAPGDVGYRRRGLPRCSRAGAGLRTRRPHRVHAAAPRFRRQRGGVRGPVRHRLPHRRPVHGYPPRRWHGCLAPVGGRMDGLFHRIRPGSVEPRLRADHAARERRDELLRVLPPLPPGKRPGGQRQDFPGRRFHLGGASPPGGLSSGGSARERALHGG